MLSRLVPADLYEVIDEYGVEATLTEVTTALQTEKGVEFDCPQCKIEPTPGEFVSTGRIDIGDPITGDVVKVICPLCQGYRKTDVEYQEVCAGKEYQPVVVAPEPPPIPEE